MSIHEIALGDPDKGPFKYVVRYRADGANKSRSFGTREEAEAFDAGRSTSVCYSAMVSVNGRDEDYVVDPNRESAIEAAIDIVRDLLPQFSDGIDPEMTHSDGRTTTTLTVKLKRHMGKTTTAVSSDLYDRVYT